MFALLVPSPAINVFIYLKRFLVFGCANGFIRLVDTNRKTTFRILDLPKLPVKTISCMKIDRGRVIITVARKIFLNSFGWENDKWYFFSDYWWFFRRGRCIDTPAWFRTYVQTSVHERCVLLENIEELLFIRNSRLFHFLTNESKILPSQFRKTLRLLAIFCYC
jgi:hypothetical protein